MPSRRRFISGVGGAGAGLLAGCTAAPDTERSRGKPASGLVWHKEIQVPVERDRGTTWTDILRLRFERDENTISGSYDPQHATGAVDGATVSVSASLHHTLQDEFGDLRYKARVGPVNELGDHLHARAYREGFNRLTLGGRATVDLDLVSVQEDLRIGYLRPIETEPREATPDSVEIN